MKLFRKILALVMVLCLTIPLFGVPAAAAGAAFHADPFVQPGAADAAGAAPGPGAAAAAVATSQDAPGDEPLKDRSLRKCCEEDS